jgi:hypothetical protein
MIIFMKFIIVLHGVAEFTVARENTFAMAAQKIVGSQCGICCMIPFRFSKYFWWTLCFWKTWRPWCCTLLKDEFNIEGHTASNESVFVTDELQNICKEVNFPTSCDYTRFIYCCRLLYMFRVVTLPIIRSTYQWRTQEFCSGVGG